MISLAGKRALVTGGARGIGAACARLLAEAGADVAIAYRSRDAEADQVVREVESHGRRALRFRGDLSTQAANDTVAEQVADAWGGIDIYVGNSGVWPEQPVAVASLDTARWRETLTLNLDGLFFGTRAVLPHMGAGARVILISSTAGQRGEAGHADYAASKGAVISFVKSLAVELGPRDITVNSVAPGWVHTDAVARPFAGDGLARIAANIPLGRVASPGDIAGPVLFLASPLARHITGEILNVNGGSVLCG